MKRAHFYIWQNGHCWQIITSSIGVAVNKWRARGIYPDETNVSGRPDKITFRKL